MSEFEKRKINQILKMNSLPNHITNETLKTIGAMSQQYSEPQADLSGEFQTNYNLQQEAQNQAANIEQEQIQQNDSNIQYQHQGEALMNQAISEMSEPQTEVSQPQMSQEYLSTTGYQNMGVDQQVSYNTEATQEYEKQLNQQNINFEGYSNNGQSSIEQPNYVTPGVAQAPDYQSLMQLSAGVESQLSALNLSDRKKAESVLEMAQKTTPRQLRPRDRAPQPPLVKKKHKEINRPPMSVDQVFIQENMTDHQIICDI